jgi:glutamate-ammonia-ligase adenylyltransferase
VLEQPRDEQALKIEVREMREKMRAHLVPGELATADNALIDLKNSAGCIVDIEFMVQYAVLAWSHMYPALSVYTDNVRILDALKDEGLWQESEALALAKAYKDFRSEAHRLSLQKLPVLVPAAQFEQQRQFVLKKWQQLMDDQEPG